MYTLPEIEKEIEDAQIKILKNIIITIKIIDKLNQILEIYENHRRKVIQSCIEKRIDQDVQR